MVTLTKTRPKVYVATITTIIYNSHGSLVETLNHMRNQKVKDHPGGNVADCCDTILIDAERLESAGAFKPKHLSCIIRIFRNTSNSRFYLWATHKNKDVMEFIKKLCVCDEDVMQPDDIITYGSYVQEYMR